MTISELTTPFSKAQLEQLIASVPFWFHSIDLGHGITTPGAKKPDVLRAELAAMQLPDLRGKSVLDIGAWDGWFSFQAERLGAARVVSLDQFMWAIDYTQTPDLTNHRPRNLRNWYEGTAWWQPETLPGKRGYDIAHAALGSQAEPVVADFMEMSPAQLGGTFDVTIFAGVLYHAISPAEALHRVAALTHGLVVIETEAIFIEQYEHENLCMFFEASEYNQDVTNWWSPNLKALTSMCRAAGFRRVEVLRGPTRPPQTRRSRLRPRRRARNLLAELGIGKRVEPEITHYRAVVHAYKY